MGMSASQARLIALTERMNDIEYQGQQINQQRTTLSNQVNALYNSLLDMTVPTPPSTSDYTKVVYTGKQGASSFKLGNVTPGKTDSTYNVDMIYSKTGHSWETNSDVNISQGKTYYQEFTDIQNELSGAIVSQKTHTYSLENDIKERVVTGYDDTDNDYEPNGDVYLKIKASDLLNFEDKLGANSDIYVFGDDNTITQWTEGTVDEEKEALNELSDSYVVIRLNQSDFIHIPNSEGDETNELLQFLYETDDDNITIHSELNNAGDIVTGYSLNDSLLSNYYVISSTGKAEAASSSNVQIDSDGKITLRTGYAHLGYPVSSSIATSNGVVLDGYITAGEDGDDTITVNGKNQKLLSAEEQLNNITDSQKKKAYIDGLRNAFQDLSKQYSEDNDFLANFESYTYQTDSGSIVYCMILKSDIVNNNGQSVPTYEYIANGTYDETVNNEECKLEFDTDGRITKLGIPNDRGGWDFIDLSASEESDDKAYKDAFNQYEYKKYLYDKEQKEINAKTSIIQAEDKNLELKLTRLDNERNAVNTEIDAVKKVVDDNIEKSFKTFSG